MRIGPRIARPAIQPKKPAAPRPAMPRPAAQPAPRSAPMPAPEGTWGGNLGSWLYDHMPKTYFFFKRAFGPKDPPPPATVDWKGITIKTNGTCPDALRETQLALEMVVRKPEFQQRMASSKVTLVIIPKNKKLTDMPEFASLKGQKTFDGRTWDGVRGVAGVISDDGRYCVGIPEENLAKLPGDGYPGKYSAAVHEISHALHAEGLDWETSAKIQDAYSNRASKRGPWVNDYSSQNSHEYFAEGTMAFFGMEGFGQGHNGPEWVKKNDPQLYAVLVEIYGQPK